MAEKKIKMPRLDLGSFTAPERRALQERFAVDYRTLHRYIVDRMFGDGELPFLFDPTGKQLFADEILQGFYYQQLLRDHPDLAFEDLDDVDYASLLRWERADETEAADDPKDENDSKS